MSSKSMMDEAAAPQGSSLTGSSLCHQVSATKCSALLIRPAPTDRVTTVTFGLLNCPKSEEGRSNSMRVERFDLLFGSVILKV